MKRSGRYTGLAISVMSRPLVLVASKASSGAIRLASSQKTCLASISSRMASTSSPQSFMQSLEVVYVILPSRAVESSLVKSPSFSKVSWLRAIRFFARSNPDSEPFQSATSYPAWA